VAMIGHFGPFVRKLTGRCNLQIFERKRLFDYVYPDWAAEQLLPRADVAIITSTTLLNKTLDHILDLARNASRVTVAGPTTPLLPEVLARRNVHFLAGMVFQETEPTLNVVSQAGGTPSFSRFARKVTLAL